MIFTEHSPIVIDYILIEDHENVTSLFAAVLEVEKGQHRERNETNN